MTLYEFLIFSIYLLFLTATIMMIQILNPGGSIRGIEESKEVTMETERVAPDSDEDAQEPLKEEYVMTENPMFSHQASPKEMDMEKVD